MKIFLKENLTKEIFGLIEKKQLINKYFLLEKETFNENINSININEIENENENTQKENNLSFWKNVDDDIIGNKLFQEVKMESIYPDGKNFNQKTYGDLRNNYGN